MWSGWTTLTNSILSSLTLTPTLLEWPCQEQRGSGLTASALVSDVSARCIHKWGMAPSAGCEYGTEEQTVDHVLLPYPIH